ncbi:Rv3654c family TadE-like protein [Streptomyces thermogriseus]|uniref:Putative Flp pilus-assembly TadG-like N-terminal domain-containing protein n=1 Tax=Streptomyces thermogriseus TaxID=75292 RepID=A0ABP4DD66_9ACTN
MRHRFSDRGSACVWSVGTIALLCVVFGTGLALGQAVVGRHRAAGAADLAALAAAGHWAEGPAVACARAERVARAQGARLVRCAIAGDTSDVTAAFAWGPFTAEVRARAGPAVPADGTAPPAAPAEGAAAPAVPADGTAPPGPVAGPARAPGPVPAAAASTGQARLLLLGVLPGVLSDGSPEASAVLLPAPPTASSPVPLPVPPVPPGLPGLRGPPSGPPSAAR